MINGASSAIFASGARIIERNPATATADACSETQGSRHSRNRGFDEWTYGMLGVDALRSPDLNCPV
jgi:hypothetical protein